MIALLIGEIELYNTFCQKFPYSMFPQETRVLCCLALPQQVLVATYTTEGLELHAFHFSDHLKLKFEGKELSHVVHKTGLVLLRMRGNVAVVTTTTPVIL